MKKIDYAEAKVWSSIFEGTIFTLYFHLQDPWVADAEGRGRMLAGTYPAVLIDEKFSLATGIPELDDQELNEDEFDSILCEVL
jgi:hypothetical protein